MLGRGVFWGEGKRSESRLRVGSSSSFNHKPFSVQLSEMRNTRAACEQ